MPEAPGFEHLMVERPGLRTHVAVVGEGDPVVLLHGFPQHWWQWRDVAPVLAAHGHRVVCPDLRGAGWTEADEPRIERESRLRDLIALFDALEIERADLISHDMGVLTAFQLTYDHSERVRTAVQLSAPPAFMKLSPQVASGFRQLPKLLWHRRGASLRGLFAEPYVVRPMAEATVDAHLAPMSLPEVDGAVRRLYRGLVMAEAARMARGVYARQRLTVPTLVVFGRQDHPWAEHAERLCPHSERYADRLVFAFVDGAAHYLPDEDPQAVAEVALDWFKRAG